MNQKKLKKPQKSQPKTNLENPIPEDIYPVIDTDLGRDNLENNITAADLQDL